MTAVRYGLGAVAFAALFVLASAPGSAASVASRPLPSAPAYTHVGYQSSVDGWNLSYDEYLPQGFSNATSYPLVIYLHGAGASTQWIQGGANEWQTYVATNTPDGATERALIANASAFGYVLAVLNTRSDAGFFVNTPCGGPQGQDVLDAISSEQARHRISSVSLIGFSMGGMGTFAIAGHNPGLIRAIAVAAVASDVYEDYAFLEKRGQPASHDVQEVYDNCGAEPSRANATVDEAFFTWLSPRFYIENFSGIRVWGSAGGEDAAIPDNASRWAYLEGNASFVASSCLTKPALGEPSGCTTTWASLNSTEFPYRFVYEPHATHDMDQLLPQQIFQFWGR